MPNAVRYYWFTGAERLHHPTIPPAMKFKTTITGRSLSEPFESVVTATDEYDARIKALRRFYNNRRICSFIAYCPFPGQDPSGQSGYGYEAAPAKSGCDLASATPLVQVSMKPC